ncbi:MAG: DUF3794 domain-containing protein [Oscillospiraceae bacterium]
MEIILNRQSTATNEVILNSTYEHPFEVDCTLPDYCRDIVKILNTTVTPTISNTSINGNRLTIDGNNVISIYYSDGEDNLSKYESKVAFSKTIELKTSPSNPILFVDSSEGYINCRAVSPRRLDIRGTIEIYVKLSNNTNEKIINEISYDSMEVKPLICEGVEAIGQFTKQFTIKESLSMLNSNEHPQNILRYDICPTVSEYKLLPGKVIIKGSMSIHIMYCCEDNKNISKSDYAIPFSQIIDCADVDEECICDIRLKVINSEIICEQSDDNNETFNISATICAKVSSYKNITVRAVKDCYCRKFNCNFKTKNINLTKIVEIVNETHNHKEIVELPNDSTEIIDVWFKLISNETICNDNKVTLEARIIICILAVADGHYCCVEKPITVIQDFITEKCHKNISFNPDIFICKYNFSDINNCKTEISCDVMINGIIFDFVNCCVIDDVTIDEKAIKKSENDMVIVYYPHFKESLWDIAKKYNTSMELLKSENNITEDYVEQGQILLITPKF